MVDEQVASNHFYCFGPFYIDDGSLLLYKDGQLGPLAPRLLRTLLLLVQSRGSELNKDYLMAQLWPDTTVEENNLTVIISASRKVFGDDPEQHKYIVTIPGRGYRFVAAVTEVSHSPISSASGKNSVVDAAKQLHDVRQLP
jgi:DNA-binding winged helix-turn-helix (wHTH) protein